MPSLDQVSVTKALPQVGLVTIDSATVRAAGMLPGPYLRTLDAIHVATAIELEADIVLAYDRRVLEAAASQGLVTEYPGGAH